MSNEELKKMADAMSAITVLPIPVYLVEQFVNGTNRDRLVSWVKLNSRIGKNEEESLRKIYDVFK